MCVLERNKKWRAHVDPVVCVCVSSECCCSLLCSQADVSWTAHQGQVPDSGLKVPLQRENAGTDATGQFPHRPARAVLPAHLQQTHLSQSWRRYHMSSLSQLLSSVKCDWFQTGSPILIISWVVFLSHIANRHTSLIFDVSLSPIRNALAQSLVLKRSVFVCEWLVKMWSAGVQLWVCPSLPSYKHTQEVLSASHLQSTEAERLFSCADLICTVRGAENKRDGWCCCCRREAACLWVNSSELPGYELFICRKSPWDEWGCSSEV